MICRNSAIFLAAIVTVGCTASPKDKDPATQPTPQYAQMAVVMPAATSEDGRTMCEKLGWAWDGAQNVCLAQAVGLQGPPGAKGDTGPQGPAGRDGVDGAQGPQGPQGLAGEKGDRGYSGLPGAPGANGRDGAQGPQGIAGDKGEQGPQGVAGAKGEQGSQGVAGEQGARGLFYQTTDSDQISPRVVGVVLGMDGAGDERMIVTGEVWGNQQVTTRRYVHSGKIQSTTIYFSGENCTGQAWMATTDRYNMMRQSPIQNAGVLYTFTLESAVDMAGLASYSTPTSHGTDVPSMVKCEPMPADARPMVIQLTMIGGDLADNLVAPLNFRQGN